MTDLSPELREKLQARGLDPDDVYAAVLEDASRMVAEIRDGTWCLEPRPRRCAGCEIDFTYAEVYTVGCATCWSRACQDRARRSAA